MGHYIDVVDDLKEPTRSRSQATPEVWNGFAQLHKAAVADGELSAKVKELMALAIAVVKQDGGTASVYGPRAWKGSREFAAMERYVAPVAEPS